VGMDEFAEEVVHTCVADEMRGGEGPVVVRWVRTGGPVGWRRRRCVAGGGGGRTLAKCAGASIRSQVSAASAGPWAVRFLPKRFAQKLREKFAVWFQLQLLAARSRPEAEPNRGIGSHCTRITSYCNNLGYIEAYLANNYQIIYIRSL
jgi:hypothetical protein